MVREHNYPSVIDTAVSLMQLKKTRKLGSNVD